MYTQRHIPHVNEHTFDTNRDAFCQLSSIQIQVRRFQLIMTYILIALHSYMLYKYSLY